LDDLEFLLNKFKHRKIVLILTGGEVTTHPQFVEVLELAKRLGVNVTVDTNGVRTVRFYKEVAPLVPAWSITLHPSQHKLDLEKIKVLTEHSFVLVAVAMDPAHWDTAVEWYKQVSEIENLKVVPIELMSDWAGATCTISYTEEQKQFLIDNPYKLTITASRMQELLKTHLWLLEMDSIATYDDGTTSPVNPYDMVKNGSNVFTGWKCYAGNDSIMLNDDGTASWANCGIKQYSSFRDIEPDDLKQPLMCNQIRCTCGTDIRSTKEL
jgi:organic radical activating enzyme